MTLTGAGQFFVAVLLEDEILIERREVSFNSYDWIGDSFPVGLLDQLVNGVDQESVGERDAEPDSLEVHLHIEAEDEAEGDADHVGEDQGEQGVSLLLA